MFKHKLSALFFIVAAGVTVLGGGQASAHSYTTLDHPSLPVQPLGGGGRQLGRDQRPPAARVHLRVTE